MVEFVNNEPVEKYAFEALQASNRRKQQRTSQIKHLDFSVTPPLRKKGENISQDLYENNALVCWAIRRHVDAVTSFYFDVDYQVSELIRDRILALFDWHGKPKNFDAARRHSRDESLRLFEISKVLYGDCLWAKIGDKRTKRYGSIQLLEGARIAKPRGLPPGLVDRVSDHGLILDEYGGVDSYIACKYDSRGQQLMFDKELLADQVIYDGYFDRYSSTRGVSPIWVAANQFLDNADAQEYNLLKIKIHAMFGYAITQEVLDLSGKEGLGTTSELVTDSDEYDDDDDGADIENEIDFSDGPLNVNLNPGEKFDAIESKSPAPSVKDYQEYATRVALLSLDIPYTFFDARKSTFAQVEADRKMYYESIYSKAMKNKRVLEEYKDWKLRQWISNGDLNGVEFEEIRDLVQVRQRPIPWLDKLKEIQAEERMVALGIKSIPTLAKERNINIYDEVDKQGEFLAYCKSKGVGIYIGDPGSVSEKEIDHGNEMEEQRVEQENVNEE